MNRNVLYLVIGALAATVSFAGAQELKLEDVASLAGVRPAQIKPNTIAFNDHRRNELVDPYTGLIRFEDWARAQPTQKKFLSLYPTYSEPKITATVDGVKNAYTDKLSMYVLEARFVLAKPPAGIDLSRYASVPFLEKIDSAIKHREITAADAIPANNPEYAFNQNPAREWCAAATQLVCIQSRYQLEGKLPSAIQLANMLMAGKKHADYLEFQSEMRVVPVADINQDDLKKLTGLDAPVIGVLEQNIFYVNQKWNSANSSRFCSSIPATTPRQSPQPILRSRSRPRCWIARSNSSAFPYYANLVPAQVLMGNSSFNTGNSLSAGLPSYSRNQIVAVANILSRD